MEEHMDPDEIVSKRVLIAAHKQRLMVLELRQAKLGNDAPASIEMEIKDIQREMSKLEWEILIAQQIAQQSATKSSSRLQLSPYLWGAIGGAAIVAIIVLFSILSSPSATISPLSPGVTSRRTQQQTVNIAGSWTGVLERHYVKGMV